MRLIHRISKNFSTLDAQFLINKNKSAVRFQSQNIQWNFEQLNYQSQAIIKGLTSMKFGSSDNFLIKTPSNQQAEAYITKIGTAGLGANLFVSKATTAEQIDRQIAENNINCFVFEPSLQMGRSILIDTLTELSPELQSQKLGSPLKLSKYPNLRALIQTNFYSYPGVYKFRAIMNYASDRFCKVNPVSVQPLNIPHSENPIVITDPANDFAFRAGILNSMINGRYIVAVDPSDVRRICSEVYGNKVDFIGTSETSLDSEVRVIVQRGSNLFSSHANRVQI